MAYEDFTTDNYEDKSGRIWLCVRVEKEGRMSCESDNGYFTAASFPTFKKWGWKKITHRAATTEGSCPHKGPED